MMMFRSDQIRVDSSDMEVTYRGIPVGWIEGGVLVPWGLGEWQEELMHELMHAYEIGGLQLAIEALGYKCEVRYV